MPEFAVIITENRGEYVANCPDVPSCWGFGSLPDEALANLRTAVRQHLKKRIELNLPVPASKVEVGYLSVGKVKGYSRSAKAKTRPMVLEGEPQVLSTLFGAEPSMN